MSRRGFSLLETIVFIVVAALVIPIFYLLTQPVIKDMMTPTSWIKARFLAERKMEELMAYTYGHPALSVASAGPVAYTDYPDYNVQWAVSYLGCGVGGGSCVGYTDPSPVLTTTVNDWGYKQIDVTVTGPQGLSYRASSAVTSRQ